MLFRHLSTDYVFDGRATAPYKEDDKPCPMSVYGASKLAGEAYALSYERGVVVRTSWLYSPYGHNFVATMLRLGAEREEIRVVNDQTGSPTYSPHLADALLQIVGQIEATQVPKSLMGLYHFSNSGQCTWFDFAQKIKEHAPFGARIVPVPTWEYPTPVSRPTFSVLNTQKIRETFGITPPPWEAGIKTYFTWKHI
jgi:dTDP-4-dehydrorhamnose reductase